MMKKLLLGTTALLGAGLMTAGSVSAAEIVPGGALDIKIQGFARFLAAMGDLKEQFNDKTGSYDFRTDSEVIVVVSGTDESTGIDYGGTIEFEGDTNSTANTDEMWIYLSGAFGEFRFGDEDGPEDNMRLGAPSISAGTGGLDGSVVDIGNLYAGFDSIDATKIIYYSPRVAGFQLGLGFTPHRNGDGSEINLTNDGGVDDMIEGGVAYVGAFGGVNIRASVTGLVGHGNSAVNDDDVYRLNAGAVLGFAGFSVAAGWHDQEVLGDDREFYNVGAAATFGPATVSASWGDTIDADGAEPHALVFSASVGLMPGVKLDGDVSFFDQDRDDQNDLSDDGVLGVVRLGIAF